MANIELVKAVRARSGVSLNACQKALTEANDDVELALEILQKRGETKGADKAGRIATEGRVHTYVHGNGSKVAVVEVNCETDFAAKSADFIAFCDTVAMQIIANAPVSLYNTDLKAEYVDRQADIFSEQMPSGIDYAKKVKIMEGKLKKWYSEICLMEQESITEPGKTVDQLRLALVQKLGENVTVRRFIRWEVGEGLL